MRSVSKKRPSVNPRALPKVSRSRRKYQDSVEVAGNRERTNQGYRIAGTTCADYETFFEYVSEGQVTDKVVSKDKIRTYRIMSGQGFAILEKNGVQKSVVLVAGQELTVEAGIAHQLITTSTNELEIVVIQSSKYEDSITVLEKSSTTAQLAAKLMKSTSNEEAVQKTVNSVRRSRSKAAEQQAQLAAERGRRAPTPPPDVQTAAAAGDPTFSVNLPPSFGRDLRGADG